MSKDLFDKMNDYQVKMNKNDVQIYKLRQQMIKLKSEMKTLQKQNKKHTKNIENEFKDILQSLILNNGITIPFLEEFIKSQKSRENILYRILYRLYKHSNIEINVPLSICKTIIDIENSIQEPFKTLISHLPNNKMDSSIFIMSHKLGNIYNISQIFPIENNGCTSKVSNDLPPNYTGNATSSIELTKRRNGQINGIWNGWQYQVPKGTIVSMSVWIKFVNFIPNVDDGRVRSNLGFKHFGVIKNDWIRECKVNEWKHIKNIEYISRGNGDSYFNLFIFDTASDGQIIRWLDFKIEYYRPK